MARSGRISPIQQFVGSAHLFSSALTDIFQNRLLRDAGGTHLSFSQLKLLQLLAIAETQTIGELAAFLGVSNAAASKTVEKLVQKGWVSRATAESDRRSAHVALTGRARHLLAVYERKRQEKLARVFDKASVGELRKMARLMDQITVGIVNHSAKPEDICLHCGIYFREKCLVRDLGGRSCLYRRRAKVASQRRSRSNENGAMKLAIK